MDNKQNNEIIFYVTVDELQNEAINRIGRELNYNEIHTAKKGIECGLSFDIGTVFKAAIEEAVEINQKYN